MAYENQEYPFEDLVEQASLQRDGSRNPLFDAVLVLQNMEAAVIRVPDLELKPFAFEKTTTKFDLTFIGAETAGDIRFTAVGKDVIVERDSSGDIVAENVGGDFRVLKDSSGDIRMKEVGGEVQIPEHKK